MGGYFVIIQFMSPSINRIEYLTRPLEVDGVLVCKNGSLLRVTGPQMQAPNLLSGEHRVVQGIVEVQGVGPLSSNTNEQSLKPGRVKINPKRNIFAGVILKEHQRDK